MLRVSISVLLLMGLVFGSGCGGSAPRPHGAKPPGTGLAEADRVTVRFLEPDSGQQTAAKAGRTWRESEEGPEVARLKSYLDNEAARFALALYALAWRLSPPAGLASPTLFIAIEPGGNFSRVGLKVVTSDGEALSLPQVPYLILAAEPRAFRTTLLHETGHAIHALLAAAGEGGGEAAARARESEQPIAPIPHSTAVVTDRRTAFNEGFAIHLETVNAHCGADEETRAYYQRRRRSYGPVAELAAEYYAPLRDLMSYAQNFARYQHVRDGLYAFDAAPSTSDYLRLQLDPARDLARLRSGAAMMATEGVVASVLFHLVAGDDCVSLEALLPRYRPLLAALRTAEQRSGPLDAVPLVEVVAALRAADPEGGKHAIFAFLDVTRGATMDAEAGLLWAQLFDAALHLEQERLKTLSFEIEGRRRSWEADALENVSALGRALGPVVVLEAPAVEVGIALFGRLQPLSFDVNAVAPAVLALVPGLSAEQVDAIMVERRKRPFADASDFFARTSGLDLPEGALAAPGPAAPEAS